MKLQESLVPSVTQLQISRISPRPQDRAILTGSTGTGKSTLALKIIPQYPWVVALDTKRELVLPGFHIHTSIRTLVDDTYSHLHYRPPVDELALVRTKGGGYTFNPAQEMLYEWVLARKNTFLYIDEFYAVLYGGHAPRGLYGILTQGRSMYIGCLLGMQRPSLIPLFAISESQWYYVFNLGLPEDQERMEKVTRIPAEWIAGLPDTQFYATQRAGRYSIGPLRYTL